MTNFAFTVPGRPTPKARPRVTSRGTYTPKATQTAEGRVLECFLAENDRPKQPVPGPVHLSVTAVFDVPASWSRKRREAAFGQPMTARPDADNLAKLVTDALNGVLYADDAQICTLDARKRYAQAHEPARLIVAATWNEEEA